MDSSKPSSSLAESLLVDSDFETHRHIPTVPTAKGFGEVKQIELQNLEATDCYPVKHHEEIHHGTFGTREEAAATYDDAAADLHFKGSKAKLKGKLHPQPSLGVLSSGNGINHSKAKLKGKLHPQPSSGVLSPGSGINHSKVKLKGKLHPQPSTFLSSEFGCNITTTRRSSEIRTTSCISKFPEEFCQTYPASMLPCQCPSANIKIQCFDISSREPCYLWKDRRFLWNQDISALGLSLELNRALLPDQVSIEVPPENEIAPNTPPGDNRTQTTSVFKAFVNGTRTSLQRLLGDPNLVVILIMVAAEAGFALVTYGSGANTSMMPTERILLDVAGISSVLGFLCCLYSLLLRGVSSEGATVLAGLGLIAGVTGFLGLMGMLWHENLKSYVAATVACIAFLTGLACLFLK